MADIDVVKKSSNTWIWLVLALVVVALFIWFAMSRGDAPQTGSSRISPIPAAAEIAVAGSRV
jgi:hypothetical protein